MIWWNKRVITCQIKYLPIKTVEVTISTLKNDARKCDNFVKPTDQRQKVLIGENIDFCGEPCVLDKKHLTRSKGWHKVCVFLSFQTSI